MVIIGKLFRRFHGEWILLIGFLMVCGGLDYLGNTHLDIDSHRYLELGQQLWDSGRFVVVDSRGSLVQDFSRTPVLPLLIAVAIGITGSQSAAVLLVVWFQRLVWSGIVLLMLPRIGRNRDKPYRSWSFLGKFILLFSPVVLYHGSLLLTDVLYSAVLFGLTRLTLSAYFRNAVPRAIGAGLSHGLATLLRPVHVLLPFVLSLCWLRKRFLTVSVVLVVATAVTAVWMERNRQGSGYFALTSLQGKSFALHREQAIRDMGPEESKTPFGPEFIAALRATNETAFTAAWVVCREHGLTDSQVDKLAGDVAFETVVSDLKRYAVDIVRNSFRLVWSRADGESLATMMGGAPGSWSGAIAGWVNVIWATVVFAVLPTWLVITRIPRRLIVSRTTLSIFLAVCYITFVPTLTTITYGRFLLPALPFIGLAYCLADVRRRGDKSPGA